jgi:hypothetical protein
MDDLLFDVAVKQFGYVPYLRRAALRFGKAPGAAG